VRCGVIEGVCAVVDVRKKGLEAQAQRVLAGNSGRWVENGGYMKRAGAGGWLGLAVCACMRGWRGCMQARWWFVGVLPVPVLLGGGSGPLHSGGSLSSGRVVGAAGGC